MIICGLDTATTTGVCLGGLGQTPVFFSRNLGIGKSHPERLSNALRLTKELISDHDVGFIGIEAPIIIPKRDNRAMVRLLMGFVGVVEAWACVKNIPCEVYEIGSLDVAFLGGRAKGRANRKAANLTRCKQLGWHPSTDDEADAGSVFHMASSRLSPSYSIKSTPLFSGGPIK